MITVPVAVAANAANPTVNTATVTGGGDPTCTNCTGTTSNPVIDAVNDTSTGQPGQPGTFNVSTNDKFPAGRRSRRRRRRVHTGGDDDAGRGGETYPGTTGSSCTVTYSVCTGAEHDDLRHGHPDGDGGAAPTLTVTKSATPAVLVVVPVARATRSRSLWRMDRRRRRSVSVTRCRRGDDQWSDHGDGRDALWLSGQWCDESGGLFDLFGHQWPGGDHGTGGGRRRTGEPDGEHGDGDGGGIRRARTARGRRATR